MALTDGDRREPVQESLHDLGRRLRVGVRRAPGDDEGSVAVAETEAGGANELDRPCTSPTAAAAPNVDQ